MKIASILVLSSALASLDPGCGAEVGGNVAKTPDGGTLDSGSSLDAGSLATQDCGALGKHVFCDDFSSPFPSRFETQIAANGSLSLDATRFVSGPTSLLATTQAVTTATRTQARVRKGFTTAGTKFALASSEWIEPSCFGGLDGVGSQVLLTNDDKYSLMVGHTANAASVVETSLADGLRVQVHDLKGPIPNGKWTRVLLEVDFAAQTMDLTVDGTKVMQGEPLVHAPTGPQIPAIAVGTMTDNISSKPSACTVHVDDVTFDFVP
jgi:hypothetical protein